MRPENNRVELAQLRRAFHATRLAGCGRPASSEACDQEATERPPPLVLGASSLLGERASGCPLPLSD
jgi:hypothetical protein